MEWLETEHISSQVIERARAMLRLQPILVEVLGEAMANQCTLIHYRQGIMRLAVPNNAFAAKIRQQLPSLTQRLAQEGLALSTLELKIIR